MAINMPAIADPLKSEAYERERKKAEKKKGEEKQLDDTFTENPSGETVKDGRKSVYIPKDSDGMPIPLKKQRVNGQDIPLPDPAADGRPHTVLGGKLRSETGEIYRQSATFPATTWPKANGYDVPWSEVHWTNHGKPQFHTNPHEHIFKYDKNGWFRNEPTEYYPQGVK